jgi:hypothetical protein
MGNVILEPGMSLAGPGFELDIYSKVKLRERHRVSLTYKRAEAGLHTGLVTKSASLSVFYYFSFGFFSFEKVEISWCTLAPNPHFWIDIELKFGIKRSTSP